MPVGGVDTGGECVLGSASVETTQGTPQVYVTVRDNNLEQALRVLKKKMQREGLFREMKNRRSYEKPSERRVRETAESMRRVRKMQRKRLDRDGF